MGVRSGMLFLAAATLGVAACATGDARGQRLHVGNTGIVCAQLPCPHRAIFAPGDGGVADRNRLRHADLHGHTPLPEMIGEPKALAAVGKAWEERGCIAIDGRLVERTGETPLLRVDRIVGPCSGAAQ